MEVHTMEKELTSPDLINGVSIPPDWPMNLLPECKKGSTVRIKLRDRVIPDKNWAFMIRRYEESEPGDSPYKFLMSLDWRDFAHVKRLSVGDKIVIQAEKPIDLNDAANVYQMEYTIKVQRIGRDLHNWTDIPLRQA